MPKLDVRLIAVTKQIRSSTHVDIGSDHGGLLVSLLKSGRIKYGIAIENNSQPFENSVQSLAKLAAEVRFGDGLEVLKRGEAKSLSICGLGAGSILRILESFPERVPNRVVLQPNRQPEILRDWALRNGFHLLDERIARGHWPYTILSFERKHLSLASDPAYQNVNHRAALLFGPLILKRYDSEFAKQLQEEESYWSQFGRLEPQRAQRLALIRKVLARNVLAQR